MHLHDKYIEAGQKIADLYRSNVTRDYKNQPSLREFVSISVSMSALMSGLSGPRPLPGNPFPTGMVSLELWMKREYGHSEFHKYRKQSSIQKVHWGTLRLMQH